MKSIVPLLIVALLFAGCAAEPARAPRDAGEPAHEGEGEARLPKGALRHYTQRLDADDTVPPDAVGVMLEQRDRMLLARTLDAGNVLQNWQWLGPGNIGGRLRAIVIHPTTPSTMWVGSVGGGIWKTTNSGASWFPLDGFAPFMAISCMVMDPKNPNRIYAGTGEGGFFDTLQGSSNLAVPMGAGIFVTQNGGTTWTRLGSTAGPDWLAVNRIAIDPNDSRVLLAGTMTGIFRSTDSGATWSKRASFPALDLDFHPTDSKQAVAGARDGYPYYSTDGGLSWTRANGIGSMRRVEIAYARGTPTTVYVSLSDAAQIITIWRSTDGGKSYVRRTSSGISTYSRYNNALWVDPTDANHLIVGGVRLYKSSNGGTTLSRAGSGFYYDMHVIVEHPGYNGTTNQIVFNGDDGGIHRTTNAKSTFPSWQELNNNLGINQFYGAAMAPNGNVVGGLQDQGSLLYTGNSEGWRKVLGGDGALCAWDAQFPNVCYAQIYWIRVFRSTNGGSSFRSIGTSTSIPDRGSNFVPPIVLDPNNTNRLYFGGASLWRADNARTAFNPTWREVKTPLPCRGESGGGGGGNAHFAKDPPCNVCTIAVAKGNSDVVWVGHNNGDVWMSSNATAANPSWRKVDVAALPDRWVGRIAIDERDSKRVYLAFMGYHQDNVWRTEDGGTTWVRITGSGTGALPSTPVTSLAIHRKIPGLVFAGTDVGLFWTTDDGQSWQTGGDATKTSPVEELVWKDDDTLLIITHGRGIYTADTVEAAGIRPVGPACGKSAVPSLVAAPPVLGAAQRYDLRGGEPNAPLTLLLAPGRASPLPLAGSCVLQTTLQGLILLPAGTTSGQGTSTVRLPIPNDRGLTGTLLTAQSLIHVLGGPLFGIAELSNGVEMHLGQ